MQELQLPGRRAAAEAAEVKVPGQGAEEEEEAAEEEEEVVVVVVQESL